MKFIFDVLSHFPGYIYRYLLLFNFNVEVGRSFRVKGVPVIHIWYGA